MPRTISITAAALLTAATALAQSRTRVVPAAWTDFDASYNSAVPFAVGSARLQQVWRGDLICSSSAMITEIRGRADHAYGALRATTIRNVRAYLGHTPVQPPALSRIFAANSPTPPTLLFSGDVSLPSFPAVPAATARPFTVPLLPPSTPFAYTRSSGNLLFELRVDGPSTTEGTYRLDVAAQAGSAVTIGEPGHLSTGDTFVFATASRPTDLTPGGSWTLTTQTLSPFRVYPGVMLLGLDDTRLNGVPLPMDLGFLGSPGNMLRIAPIASEPLAFAPFQLLQLATNVLPIPTRPELIDARVYAQSVLVDPGGGVAATRGSAVQVGDAGLLPIGWVWAYDSNALLAYTVDPSHGQGLVVELVGSFQ